MAVREKDLLKPLNYFYLETHYCVFQIFIFFGEKRKMKKYSIIITIVFLVAAALAFLFWRQNSKIHSLETELLGAQTTISLQDSKIKEQLSVISLLEVDNKNKETSIEALQTKINLSQKNCEELIENFGQLSEVSNQIGKSFSDSSAREIEILLPSEVLPSAEVSAVEKIPLSSKSTEGETVHVLNQEGSKSYIKLRNNILRNYR